MSKFFPGQLVRCKETIRLSTIDGEVLFGMGHICKVLDVQPHPRFEGEDCLDIDGFDDFRFKSSKFEPYVESCDSIEVENSLPHAVDDCDQLAELAPISAFDFDGLTEEPFKYESNHLSFDEWQDIAATLALCVIAASLAVIAICKFATFSYLI